MFHLTHSCRLLTLIPVIACLVKRLLRPRIQPSGAELHDPRPIVTCHVGVVVPDPPLVRRGLLRAVRRVLPLLLASERESQSLQSTPASLKYTRELSGQLARRAVCTAVWCVIRRGIGGCGRSRRGAVRAAAWSPVSATLARRAGDGLFPGRAHPRGGVTFV